jgi:muramidase (phage lysozyme)
MPRIAPVEASGQNVCAFLDMIAYSEGTAGKGDDGYNVIVGGKTFASYGDHPRTLVHLRPGLASTAAGRYQLLERYFDAYKTKMHVPDFSPIAQDAIAIEQIQESGALNDIAAGRFAVAIGKCAHIWASLPGAGYGQRENKLEDLRAAYCAAGGSCAAIEG